jgi:hypothetical protein
MTTPRIIESRRRLDFIMDTRLLSPGMVSEISTVRFMCLKSILLNKHTYDMQHTILDAR